MHRFIGLIILISLALILSACSLSLAGDITPPPGSEQIPAVGTTPVASSSSIYPIVPPDLASGAVIYKQECAQCHGTKGLGDGPRAAQLSVPAASLGLTDFARLNTPAEWYTIVTQGNTEGFMPAFKNLTDRQRWDVVAYAMSLSTTDDMVAQGKAIYQENCTICHGESGEGDGPHANTLSETPGNLTDQALMAQSSSARLYEMINSGISPDMPSFADSLDENQIWSLVAYIRSLTYAKAAQVANSSGTNAYPDPNSAGYPAPQVTSEGLASSGDIITPTTGISSTIPFTGTVAVQLVNGSGAELSSDASVTLYGFDAMQVAYSETITSTVEGLYTFNDVYVPEGRVFLAGVQYASGTYGSDIVTLSPNNPDLKLDVTVYDSTTDISSLTTDRVHIFFDFIDPQVVQVIEVFIISNSSQQAVVPPTPDGTVVTFPLPEGYTNLQFQDGELGDTYVEVPQGFADRRTVNPGMGEHTVIFAFQMPYNRNLEFSQPMFLPTSAAVVMVPEGGMKVDSDLLRDGGTRDFQGNTYHLYDANSLIAGSSLKFTLSGSPKKAATSLLNAGTTQNLAIGIGVFGVVLVGVGLWLYRRNQLRVATQPADFGADQFSAATLQEATPEDVDTLMDAIIALDDQYHAGNLPEEAYLTRRAALKDKLRQLEQG